MFKRFISLEWKQFRRASYFQKGLAIKILMGFLVLYFGGIALAFGAGVFFVAKKMVPDMDPVETVNKFLIFWFLFDLLFRYFMQQLPVMNVKPLMVAPVKRSSVIHYLLGKTSVSFFNILPLFVFIPFSIVMLFQGYPVLNVIGWFISVFAITLCLNFTNFLVNKNNVVFYSLLVILVLLAGLEYYKIYNVSESIGAVFNFLFNNPYIALLPILLLIFLYKATFNFVKKGFYLDDAVSKKVKEVNTTDLSWMNRFGAVAPFIKNDVKLIWRNVRPKQVVLMSCMFLFYGLFFFTSDTYKEMPALLAFAAMFITGGFLISFGQLVPSWDSEYYKMLMSQNIPYKQYLESKWYLMVFAVVVSFILATPYIYFGWDIYAMIAAGAVFNVGLNSFITLFGGALNRVPIELNVKAKAFSNTNGFNPVQLLIGLPKVFLPMILFYIPYKLIGFNAGLITVAMSGVLGIVFRKYIFNFIVSIYQKGKYKTIAAFSEKK